MKTSFTTQTRICQPHSNRGFALIVTLSLMILLTVIAVGLLTLSSISLRASSQSDAIQVARANARMALMLAIGDLQKYSGKDTRITARADILDSSNPPVLGVWKSWEGTDHETTGSAQGRPISPDYASKKTSRFIAWLTSTPSVPKNTVADLPVTKKGAAGRVTLVGENSVGTKDADKRQVYLDPTLVGLTNQKGAYAWWVSGENQKARLPNPYVPTTEDAASWSALAKSHAIADTKPFGLDSLLTEASVKNPSAASPVSKSVSLKQSDLISTGATSTVKKSQEYFHDLSTSSIGLLTNSATGGWRKDLSLASENWNSLAASGLPFFRVTPESDIQYTRATSSNVYPDKSILYPWSTYRGSSATTTNTAIYRFPAIGTWTNLANYARLYLKASATTGAMQFSSNAVPINGDTYLFTHEPRILPVIARMQWVFAHRTKGSLTVPGKYDLEVVVNPVITLWNPYNVRLTTTTALNFTLAGSLPPVIDYKINGVSLPKKFTLQSDRMAGGTLSEAVGMYPGPVTYTLASSVSLKPGETQVYSASGATNNLVLGYTATSGVAYTVAKGVGNSAAPEGGTISTAMTFDSEFNDGMDGVGMYLNMVSPGVGALLAYRMIYEKTAAKIFYPAKGEVDFPIVSFAEAAKTVRFLSVTFGARMASNTHLASKGFVQSSPFVNYTAMGKKALKESTIQWDYPGVYHNVNSPFEYSFQGLSSGNSFFPNWDPATGRGYIVTGFQNSDGLSRCVIDELPGRPLSSLGELQNWDARYENPVPPYSFNIVGNSDATPLIAQDAVVNSAEASAKGGENLQNDDSYCLNHLLFDDWFFSSIAPDVTAFGKPSSSASVQTTYKNLLTNPAKPLANRSYKAISEDVNDSTAALSKNLNPATTSWKTIASRLEVEGMFNVNSTSVAAWRALLGHARNQKIPYIDGAGNPQLSSESDYAISRFSVAGDVESKKSGTSGTKVDCAEYAGYRVFTEKQLDFLAEEIVKQVRLRGPFLSLSEFVNRQLSSDVNLALAGAIQTALNQLSNSSQDPFKVLKELTPATPNVTTANPPGAPTGYKFSKAAEGFNIYGIPGWARQADVLRPLAPILTARDDTFTVRSYGDARDPSGKIKATAVCEATVRRTRNFVDSADDSAQADLSTASGTVATKKSANQIFGRRYEIISFRWLSAGEI